MVDKQYFIPDDIEEALSLKAEGGPTASFLAGGTFLNWGPVKDTSTTYIDLKKVVGRGVTREGESLVIGALITLQEIVDDARLPKALRTGAGWVISRQVRNQATLGGNIGAGRADSNVIPVLLALGARIRLGRGNDISLSSWIAEPVEDIITHVIIPHPDLRVEAAKVSRSANAYPVVSAAVTLEPKPIIILGGAFPAITRLEGLEQALGQNAELPSRKIEALVQKEISPQSDIHGSAEYKGYIASVTVADLIVKCRTADVSAGSKSPEKPMPDEGFKEA